MPVDLLINSKRVADPDNLLLSVCASWPDYRNLWIPGIAALPLAHLGFLVEIGVLHIDSAKKSVVTGEMLQLKAWIDSRPPQASSYSDEQLEMVSSRIANIMSLIDSYIENEDDTACIYI